jgi:hypothetical protein
MTRWQARARSAGRVALLIMAIAVGGAVAGTVAGTRVAAESAPVVEPVVEPAVESSAPSDPEAGGESSAVGRLQRRPHGILGRVVRIDGERLRVRRPRGRPIVVQLGPNTVVRRAGERVAPDAIQLGDRVLVVGKATDEGVLLARGIRARPAPPRPAPGEATPIRPLPGAPDLQGIPLPGTGPAN